MLGIVFRVQHTFSNMKSVAMLSEKIVKVGMIVMMDGYYFRVQCTLPNMESVAMLREK